MHWMNVNEKETLKLFSIFYHKARHLQSVRMRIFLTSRPELPIRLEFKNMSADAHQDVILQDIPQVTIEHDISVYLMDELMRIKEEYNDINIPRIPVFPRIGLVMEISKH